MFSNARLDAQGFSKEKNYLIKLIVIKKLNYQKVYIMDFSFSNNIFAFKLLAIINKMILDHKNVRFDIFYNLIKKLNKQIHSADIERYSLA